MKNDAIIDALCDALELELGELTIEDSADSVSEWDSIGTLAIIAKLEDEFGIAVGEEEMQSLQSVRSVIGLLRERNLVDDAV